MSDMMATIAANAATERARNDALARAASLVTDQLRVKLLGMTSTAALVPGDVVRVSASEVRTVHATELVKQLKRYTVYTVQWVENLADNGAPSRHKGADMWERVKTEC